MIEIVAEGKQEFKTFYSNELTIVFNEAFGELKVMREDANGKKKGVGKIYVKVFSQNKNGKEEFFRDGYTDIRGKFEYAMASGESLDNIKKFAVLVMSEKHGSMIKEINAPKNENNTVVDEVTGQTKVTNLMQNKQDRIISRYNYVQSKKM